MIGLPHDLQTKKDYENAASYAVAHNDGKAVLKTHLISLRDDVYILTLKESSKDVPADEQTPDDYEKTENPGAEKYRLGFSDDEINALIAQLEA